MAYSMNTLVEETKSELVEFINSKIEKGLPISVAGLILENINNQVRVNTENVIKMESELSEKEEKGDE